MSKPITFQLLWDISRQWFDLSESDRKHQRFGQYFCNTVNLTDSKLYYEESTEAAMNHIMQKYLSGDSVD